MTPTMLRQLWSLIETNQATLLLKLDDAILVQWLLRQLMVQQPLSADETSALRHYLNHRLPLIRDLAQQRLVPS
ncbi:MAG: hypothetical protein VKJ24_10965 [Synechococcales bacterium]|nr:hypothetical protein [Synechococcales bacterium]